MTYKLTTITCLLLCIITYGCWDQKQPVLTNAQLLVNQINSEDENKSYTAILLLSHIVIEDNIYNQLSELFEKEKNPLKKLFIAYTLSVRTQELKYSNAFIDLYPTGKDQKDLWRLSGIIDYVAITTPLQSRLSGFAAEDEKAFKKLISAYDFAFNNEVYLTALIDQLLNLCKRVPDISHKIKTEYPEVFKSIQEEFPGALK